MARLARGEVFDPSSHEAGQACGIIRIPHRHW